MIRCHRAIKHGWLVVPQDQEHARLQPLIDLQNKCLEIHRQPSQEGYRQILLPANTKSVSLSLVPGIRIRMAELWS
jgi:Uma2 family endonuclease